MAVIGDTPNIALDEILVASDFTATSEAALEYAQALAKRFGSKIIVANIVDLSAATNSEQAVIDLPVDDMRRRSAEDVERTVSQLRAEGFKAEGTSVEAYNPAARSIQLAEVRGAGLLVVGTNARRGLSRFVLGSFAEGVIRHAKCPVLTIGPETKPLSKEGFSLYTVLFATDLHHHTAEKAAVALAFAEDSLGRIFLCHVVERSPRDLSSSLEQQFEAEAALKKLIPAAAYEWCAPECEVDYGNPAARILALAEQHHADLIVLGAHRGATWVTHFTQGVVGAVIEKATCPVMTICAD